MRTTSVPPLTVSVLDFGYQARQYVAYSSTALGHSKCRFSQRWHRGTPALATPRFTYACRLRKLTCMPPLLCARQRHTRRPLLTITTSTPPRMHAQNPR
eukprot:3586932-Rhodomonas_salina.2